MLTVSWSLTRQQFGEQPFWAVVALAAMIGDMGKPGGGVGFGYTITNYLGNNVFKMPYAPFPQGRNAVSDFIPVARSATCFFVLASPSTMTASNMYIPTLILSILGWGQSVSPSSGPCAHAAGMAKAVDGDRQ